MNHGSEQRASQYAPGEANGFALASFVLGLVWLMGLGSILALVFGYVAKGEIERSRGAQAGRGFAIAGIVLGWVGVAFIVAAVVMMALGVVAWPMMPMMR